MRMPIMLQHFIIQFPFNYLSTGRLQEVKNKRKFQIFSPKRSRGRWCGGLGPVYKEVG